MKYLLTVVNIVVLICVVYLGIKPVFSQQGDFVYFFDGTYGFDSRDAELGKLVTDIRHDRSGEIVERATVVVPSGCSILTMKRHYIIGVYNGPVTVVNEMNSAESLDCVMFVLKRGVKEIKYCRPSDKETGRLFLGEEIEGEVRFY